MSIREGRREEGKVREEGKAREEEVNGKVRESRQLMGRGLSVRILVRRECKRLALRNSQKNG